LCCLVLSLSFRQTCLRVFALQLLKPAKRWKGNITTPTTTVTTTRTKHSFNSIKLKWQMNFSQTFHLTSFFQFIKYKIFRNHADQYNSSKVISFYLLNIIITFIHASSHPRTFSPSAIVLSI